MEIYGMQFYLCSFAKSIWWLHWSSSLGPEIAMSQIYSLHTIQLVQYGTLYYVYLFIRSLCHNKTTYGISTV